MILVPDVDSPGESAVPEVPRNNRPKAFLTDDAGGKLKAPDRIANLLRSYVDIHIVLRESPRGERVCGHRCALVTEAQVFEGGDRGHIDCDLVQGRAKVVREVELDIKFGGNA